MNLNRPETVLNRCREIMSERINDILVHMYKYAEALCRERASMQKDKADEKLYQDAVRIIRLKKYEMRSRFKSHFTSLYQSQVRNLIRGVDHDATKEIIKSSSNGNNGLEYKTLQSTMQQVSNDCHLALMSLDNRINRMLQHGRMAPITNPLRPEIIFDAFWESCRDTEIKPEIRILLVSLFDHFMALELGYLYEDINSWLARQDLEADRQHQLN